MTTLPAAGGDEQEASPAAKPLWDRHISRKSPETRESLILHYMQFAECVAMEYYRRTPGYIDKDEIIAAGFLGLVHAVDHFDVAMTGSFTKFTAKYIYYRIKDYLRELEYWSRRSDSPKRKNIELNRMCSESMENVSLKNILVGDWWQSLARIVNDKRLSMLMEYYGKDISIPEIAKRYGISRQKVHSEMYAARKLIRENLTLQELIRDLEQQ